MDSISKKIVEQAAALKKNRSQIKTDHKVINDENSIVSSKINELKYAIISPKHVESKSSIVAPSIEIDSDTPSIKDRLLKLRENIISVQYDPSKDKEKVKSELEEIIEQRNSLFGAAPRKNIIITKSAVESTYVEPKAELIPKTVLVDSSLSEIGNSTLESTETDLDEKLNSTNISIASSLSIEAKHLPKPVFRADVSKSSETILPEKRNFEVNDNEQIEIKSKKLFSPEINSNLKFPSTPNTPKVLICESPEPDKNVEPVKNSSIDLNIKNSIIENREIPDDSKINPTSLENIMPNKYPLASYLPFSWENAQDVVRLPSVSDEQISTEKSTRISETSIFSTTTCLVHNEAYYQQVLSDCAKNLSMTQSIMSQAIQALIVAYEEDRIRVSYLSEAIEAERLLLLSTQRKNALQEREATLKDRIFPCTCKNGSVQNYYSNVTITNISVFIKREFFLTNIKESGVYYFCIVASSGTFVFCTPAVSICNVDHDHINFPTNFKFDNLLSTDSIRLQLFAYCPGVSDVSIHRRGSIRSKAFKFLKLNPVNKSKQLKKINSCSITEANYADPPRLSKFNYVGEISVQADKNICAKIQIENILCDCPVTGYLFLNMNSEYKNNCLAKGFLTIFERGEICSWDRYWCGLYKDQISLWKYPIDDASKEPVNSIQLNWGSLPECVRLLPSHECPRAHSFEISTQVKDSNNVLGYSIKQYWLSADSKEERQSWMDMLVIHQKKSKQTKPKF